MQHANKNLGVTFRSINMIFFFFFRYTIFSTRAKMSIDNEYLFNGASEGIRNGYIHSFNDGKLQGFLLEKINDIVSDNPIAENVVTNFLKNLKIRWKRANRNRKYFVSKNKEWLAIKVYQSPLVEASGRCRGPVTPDTISRCNNKYNVYGFAIPVILLPFNFVVLR